MNKKALAVLTVIILLSISIAGYSITTEKPIMEKYEETIFDFEVKVSLKNLGIAPAFDIPLRLAVPTDHEPQQIVLSSSFSAQPERFSNGSYGNKFSHFTIERLDPTMTWNLSIYLKVKLISLDYNLIKEKIGEYTNETDRYLVEDSYINVNDPAIQNLAKKLSGESDDILDTIWSSYEWVVDNIAYQQVPGEYDARTTLRNGEGGSAEISNLFIALLRANMIPARRLSGWGNHFSEGKELHLSRFSHGWAEFYLPNYGWIPADPTWGKNQKFDNYAKTDSNHIIMARGSGIHYYWRGPYAEPYGETELDSDYRVIVKNADTKNLSKTRLIITYSIFFGPVPFVIFIINKRIKLRKL